MKWPLISTCLNLYRAAYQAADIVVANSEFVGKVIERFYRRPAKVLYPVIDLKPQANIPVTTVSAGPVLFIKPQRIKGIEVLLKVAEIMPERRFLVVGHASTHLRRKMCSFSNIDYQEWTDDMAGVYQGASILFGPSQIPEPFGRVFFEAGLAGLPSVASRAGGIPEVVGAGGRLLPQESSAETWAEAIREVSQEDIYQDLSRAARQQALNIQGIHTPTRLVDILGLTSA